MRFYFKRTYFFCFLWGTMISFSAQGGELDPFHVYSKIDKNLYPKSCQTLLSKKTLSLEEALEIALCQNPALRQTYLTAKSQSALFGVAQSEYLPTVSLSASSTAKVSKIEQEKREYSPSSTAGVALSYLLYDFGGRSMRYEKAENEMTASDFSYQKNVQDLVYDVIEGYYAYLSAEDVVKSAEMSEEAYRVAYNIVSKRYKLGLVKKLDKLQSETSLAQAEIKTNDAKKDLKVIKATLLSLLHMPVNKDISLSFDTVSSNKILQEKLPSLGAFLKTATQNRPDLKALEYQKRALKNEISSIQRESYPEISLEASMNTGRDFDVDKNTYDGKAMLTLSVPLFTGFNQTYREQKATHSYRQGEAKIEALKDTIEKEVSDAFYDYQNKLKRYAQLEKVLQGAKESEKLAKRSYEVGKEDMSTWLDALAILSQSRTDYASARFEALVAKFNLLKAVGEKK
ncbi:MAG: TolC family protein [Alphaproteobacteria bacterium]|nr:TolC family protein [Alphaproteobacteria bacterium]